MGLDAVAEVSVVAAARRPPRRAGRRGVPGSATGAPLRPSRTSGPTSSGVGLARQKWPESLHEVDDFPRTPSGKVQKFRLRQQLREAR